MHTLSSVPLGSLVDNKLKAKIWTCQFVELELLVGDNKTPVLIMYVERQQPSVHMREQAHKRIYNITEWTDAFLIYMAIYTERYPAEVAALLKYVQLVRSMLYEVELIFDL